MQFKSFTRRSLPVDFSLLSIADLNLTQEIINDLISKASITKEGSLGGEDTEIITVPLQRLATVFGIEYSISVEISKITSVMNEIGSRLEALTKFEEIFLKTAQERNKKRKERPQLSLLKGAWRG